MDSFRRLHCHNYSLIWSPFCRTRKFTLLTNPGKMHCYFFRENHFFSCICQVLRVLVGSFILQVDFFFSSLSSLIIWFTLIFCLDGVSLLARIKRLPMPCNIIMYPGTSLHWLSVFLIHSFVFLQKHPLSAWVNLFYFELKIGLPCCVGSYL